jgi:murein DD-endopeptidase MepM/ murein hydrolase activator NlpD
VLNYSLFGFQITDVRGLAAFLLFFEITAGITAQSFATFRDLENCGDWPCVVALTAAHPSDRLDRSIPWRLPLGSSGALSSTYGYRIHPIVGTAKFHFGVDIAAAVGTPVYASGSGRARTARSPTLGAYVVVDHLNGFQSVYAHLEKTNLSGGGDGVHFLQQGECIGWVGTTGLVTGPHLHWSVTFRGEALDPLELRRSVLTIF